MFEYISVNFFAMIYFSEFVGMSFETFRYVSTLYHSYVNPNMTKIDATRLYCHFGK
jgi:hypothetical protein